MKFLLFFALPSQLTVCWVLVILLTYLIDSLYKDCNAVRTFRGVVYHAENVQLCHIHTNGES